jgi:N-acetylneuraminate synthase
MTNTKSTFQINNKNIGESHPAYFIADIAANHDGDLERAKDLIYLAAEAGADAAKFQHFDADTIVSDFGFKKLGAQKSHQSKWKKSVYEIYKNASVNLDWTIELVRTCKKANIAFFTSPYSLELVDYIDKYVPAYKIGSGDITWHEIIKHIAKKGKPYILATGASSIKEVEDAVSIALKINPNLALLQCNTNYIGTPDNLKYINLNVLKTYKSMYPNMIIGLSDHTPGDITVLGAISLGAKIIEKHFTDNTSREGPDHAFSMDPFTWKEMVQKSREIESSLGSTIKKIEDNERETKILQRRSIRIKKNMAKNEVIKKNDLICLRPCPEDAILPYELNEIIGKALNTNKEAGDYLRWKDIK